jgi:hypothetical protein
MALLPIRNRKAFYIQASLRYREVIDHDERKAAGVLVLQISTINLQGPEAHEAAWLATDSAMQGLRPEVHAAAPEAERAN